MWPTMKPCSMCSIVNEFDLVLMHMNLPVMNGIETTKLYRFLSLDRPYVPIVAVMAEATEEAKRRCQEAGMDACITMPIERHQLRRDHSNTRSGMRAKARDLSRMQAKRQPRNRAIALPRLQLLTYTFSVRSRAWVAREFADNSLRSSSTTASIFYTTLPTQ